MICDNCKGENVKKESNAIIYGRTYGNGICFYCHDCKASVGTHDNGKPLGTLATKNTQTLRKACHDIFDPIWRYNKGISRSTLYIILANKMKIHVKNCHFGIFQRKQCLEALAIISEDDWWKV